MHQKQIDVIEEQLKALRGSLYLRGISYDKDKVQASPSADRIADIYARIEDKEGELLTAAADHAAYVAEVSELINRLPNPDESYILTMRYICGIKFENLPQAVGDRMTYSDRHIWRLLSRATRHLSDILTEEDVIKMSV